MRTWCLILLCYRFEGWGFSHTTFTPFENHYIIKSSVGTWSCQSWTQIPDFPHFVERCAAWYWRFVILWHCVHGLVIYIIFILLFYLRSKNHICSSFAGPEGCKNPSKMCVFLFVFFFILIQYVTTVIFSLWFLICCRRLTFPNNRAMLKL